MIYIWNCIADYTNLDGEAWIVIGGYSHRNLGLVYKIFHFYIFLPLAAFKIFYNKIFYNKSVQVLSIFMLFIDIFLLNWIRYN